MKIKVLVENTSISKDIKGLLKNTMLHEKAV